MRNLGTVSVGVSENCASLPYLPLEGQASSRDSVEGFCQGVLFGHHIFEKRLPCPIINETHFFIGMKQQHRCSRSLERTAIDLTRHFSYCDYIILTPSLFEVNCFQVAGVR